MTSLPSTAGPRPPPAPPAPPAPPLPHPPPPDMTQALLLFRPPSPATPLALSPSTVALLAFPSPPPPPLFFFFYKRQTKKKGSNVQVGRQLIAIATKPFGSCRSTAPVETIPNFLSALVFPVCCYFSSSRRRQEFPSVQTAPTAPSCLDCRRADVWGLLGCFFFFLDFPSLRSVECNQESRTHSLLSPPRPAPPPC